MDVLKLQRMAHPLGLAAFHFLLDVVSKFSSDGFIRVGETILNVSTHAPAHPDLKYTYFFAHGFDWWSVDQFL